MAAIPMPLILDDALIQISTDGTAANLKELACVANHVELSPDVTVTTVDTMCGSTDYPGAVKWALVLTLYQSFDPDATEDVLSAALESGGPVMFAIAGYRSKPVGADNPVWSGLVIPQPYAPINGDAGDASTVEIEWSVQGEPLKGEIMPTIAELDLYSRTRPELDELATSLGLDPASYANKDAEIAAIREAQSAAAVA